MTVVSTAKTALATGSCRRCRRLGHRPGWPLANCSVSRLKSATASCSRRYSTNPSATTITSLSAGIPSNQGRSVTEVAIIS
jgi:hypothetical protein